MPSAKVCSVRHLQIVFGTSLISKLVLVINHECKLGFSFISSFYEFLWISFASCNKNKSRFVSISRHSATYRYFNRKIDIKIVLIGDRLELLLLQMHKVLRRSGTAMSNSILELFAIASVVEEAFLPCRKGIFFLQDCRSICFRVNFIALWRSQRIKMGFSYFQNSQLWYFFDLALRGLFFQDSFRMSGPVT